MAESSCGCHHREAVLDVRETPPRIRHPKIFQTFDALPLGGGFVLVNDHDPKPLLYQFQFERAGTFDWRYLEEGPETWRVEITRRAGAAPARIVASQTVGEVLGRSPGAREIMQRFGIDHCCSAGLNLAEAAAAAGVDVEQLLVALRRAVGEPGTDALEGGAAGVMAGGGQGRADRPAVLDGLQRVDLDVRADIRDGREPFVRIMAAVKRLGVRDVLVLQAPFEPIPLYDVLGRRGFTHWTERRTADDWSVWFYRGPVAAAVRPEGVVADPAAEPPATGDIDVRGLEPPEPMARVLERLDGLGPEQQLRVLHDRRPMFLYPLLEARGFVHETHEPAPGHVEILIRRPPASTGSERRG